MKYTIWQKPVNNLSCFNCYHPEEGDNDLDNFCSVWTGEAQGDDRYTILEAIFTQFNVNHPEHYAGRSLSVGDIVQLENEFYFCDMVGWKKIDIKN